MVRWKLFSLSGLSQTRMAYCVAKSLHFTHTGHPGQHLLEVGLGVVRQILVIHAAVFGNQSHHHQIVTGGLADLDALLLHHFGKRCHGELQLILHLGPGEVRVGPRGKVSSIRPAPEASLVADM